VETAKILIDAGAALNMRDNDGDTPMLLAVRTHEHEIVELLLERGADAEILNNDGETALICAANEGHINTIQTLLRGGVKVDPNILGEHMLAVAMALQDIEAIRMHIMSTKPGDPSAIRRYWNLLQDYSMPDLLSETVLPLAAKLFSARGSTLLHWACLAGRCQLAEQLLDLDIPYMAVDHNGWTPWHIATRGQGWWLPRMEDVSKKLECKAGVPATLPFQRLPTRWINADCDDSSRRFQLSEEGLVAELLCASFCQGLPIA
jgi:hypothetical protein